MRIFLAAAPLLLTTGVAADFNPKGIQSTFKRYLKEAQSSLVAQKLSNEKEQCRCKAQEKEDKASVEKTKQEQKNAETKLSEAIASSANAEASKTSSAAAIGPVMKDLKEEITKLQEEKQQNTARLSDTQKNFDKLQEAVSKLKANKDHASVAEVVMQQMKFVQEDRDKLQNLINQQTDRFSKLNQAKAAQEVQMGQTTANASIRAAETAQNSATAKEALETAAKDYDNAVKTMQGNANDCKQSLQEGDTMLKNLHNKVIAFSKIVNILKEDKAATGFLQVASQDKSTSIE